MKFNKIFIYVIILIILIFSGCIGKSVSEEENNDSFQKANKVYSDSQITGDFKSKNDLDFYKLDLRSFTGEENLLRLSITGIRGVAIKLSIYNDKKRLIHTASDFFLNQREILANIKIVKNIYYIAASIQKSENSVSFPTPKYKLSLKTIKVLDTELEPNNTVSTAQEILPNLPITGYFSPFFASKEINPKIEKQLKKYFKNNSGNDFDIDKMKKFDIDIYKVRLPDQENYNATIILTNTKNVNVLLFLMDSNRKIIEFRNNHGFGTGEGISNLTLKGGKPYYIVVMGFERTINFNPLKDTYKLEFKTSSFAKDQEIEPNNSLKQATPITSAVMKGYLSPVKDQDWYKLNITPVLMKTVDRNYTEMLDHSSTAQGQRPDRIMKVTLKSVAGINLAFEITDEQGKVLSRVDSTGAGKTEVFANFNVSFGKVYYIVVKGAKNNVRESFKKQYRLEIEFRDRTHTEEAEPNDSKTLNISSYNQIKLDTGINGYISPGGDVDYFYVTILIPGRYKITVTGVPGIRFKVEVFDSDDFSMGKAASKREGQSVSFIKMFNSTGLHYIVLSDVRSKKHYNNTVKYFLNIKRLTAENGQSANE